MKDALGLDIITFDTTPLPEDLFHFENGNAQLNEGISSLDFQAVAGMPLDDYLSPAPDPVDYSALGGAYYGYIEGESVTMTNCDYLSLGGDA
jgi:hypothetical protein